MCCEFGWDDEVDVVCTDAGFAGLALAIATVERDGEVLVASRPPVQTRPGSQSWFAAPAGDPATTAYLAELAADIEVDRLTPRSTVLPVRPLRAPQPGPKPRAVPPFDGSRLRNWAAECISAPTGYLYTSVTDWPSTPVEAADGDSLEVVAVGGTAEAGRTTGSILEWLTAEARSRGADVKPVDDFERLVFEEGVVAGAVFATPDGPFAVRARHGVLICRAFAALEPEVHDVAAEVALVGRVAARFGRVELLVQD